MRRTTQLNKHLKQGLTTIGVAVLVVVALPLLVVAIFMARFLFLTAVAVAIPVVVFSPSLRNRLLGHAEAEPSYKGVSVPKDVWVHPHHAWARTDSAGDILIGVDDLVARVLGPLDEVRLPLPGQALVEGQDMLWLRCGGRTLAVKAPVSGKVVTTNAKAAADPKVINQSPYGAGWTLKLTPSAPPASWQNLKHDRDATQWFHDEVDRFLATVSAQPSAIPVLQDGGVVTDHLHSELDESTWQRVQAEFFGGAA